MPGKEVTRADLRRALVVNAATKPLNVAVPAAVLIAGILLSTWWLVPVAIAVCLGLALTTFLDEDEAKDVGQRVYGADRPKPLDAGSLATPIREQVEAARREREAIHRTIGQADLAFSGVSTEVDGLIAAVERTAKRAQMLNDHLVARGGDASPRLKERWRAYNLEMREVVTALRDVHDGLVEASLANAEARDAQLAGDIRELRERVDAVTDGLSEAYGR